MSKKYLTIKQSAKFLGCPTSFVKAEVERSRLFASRRPFRRKIERADLVRYRSDTNGSIVWKQFSEAGYKPNLNI